MNYSRAEKDVPADSSLVLLSNSLMLKKGFETVSFEVCIEFVVSSSMIGISLVSIIEKSLKVMFLGVKLLTIC